MKSSHYLLWTAGAIGLVYFIYRGSGSAGSCSFVDWVTQQCGGGLVSTSSSGT